MPLSLRAVKAALLIAIMAAATPGRAPASTIFVEGVVVDAAGKPVADAVVRVSGANVTLTQRTDANCHFVFRTLTVGRYELTAGKDSLAATQVIDVTAGGLTLRVLLFRLQTIGRVAVVRNPVATRSGSDVSLDSSLLARSPTGSTLPGILT
jgi:Carboxypeptidase regulatory-like domain